jgi:DMSO/TMAO reductase YedYZ molybdopterin-dependent catalytic subunit
MLSSMQLPPGQQLVAAGKWPLVGERSARDTSDPWTVSVAGLVDGQREFSLGELAAMPRTERMIDIHCVTRWSKSGVRFGGVLLADLFSIARPLPTARYVSFVARSERSHSTSLALGEAIELGTMIALDCDGHALPEEHGGPVRVVVPGRYFYKSLKWLAAIELLAEDRLGYWEATAGYHNHADPWREERYMAPGLTKQQAAAILATHDWSDRDLRSVDASDRQLAGLVAHRALLRDADFRRSNLQRACFAGANLSNAHFERSDLRGAKFVGADCEGADFSGADLREVDFSRASLFGASFCSESSSGETIGEMSARLDTTTRIDPAAIEQLTPIQQAFVRRALSAPPPGA